MYNYWKGLLDALRLANDCATATVRKLSVKIWEISRVGRLRGADCRWHDGTRIAHI